ncbi:L-lactate dehydrogenase [Sporomusa acidovorans]|uniref:L-lactate dehydrogenase n=1 Tax=Sporomusa acidovorans (strain ATCC 49682 / DSM 3132 / Mol) TaxID=1123286 RepID=A0ABZ3JA37_SPOA4|nr:L-lactate dehydrogenase [Sporomusa acidovorans]OZC16254.1 L-lactate dehydrogenase [Sporomusa acidovorans DSM 3132]SDE32721.1 L-lactate dehydrogenase [Sporomusa acidovorans]
MKATTNKLVIVGVGHVGSQVLATAVAHQIASEIALIDIEENRAIGEALDADHATPFDYNANINVHKGTYEDCADAKVIIMCAGPSILPGENLDRLVLAGRNAETVKDVMSQIVTYTKDAVVIFITNPLDITTYYAANHFGYPKGKLFGTGTTLETARLKRILADRYHVAPASVQAFMLGEHGNSAFPAWSMINIGGVPANQLDQYFDVESPLDKEAIGKEVVQVAYDVLNGKGWTNTGIAMGAVRLAKAVMFDERFVGPVSVTLAEEYGIAEKVSLSMPCVIGKNGVEKRLPLPLSPEEVSKFKTCAKTVRAVLDSIHIN